MVWIGETLIQSFDLSHLRSNITGTHLFSSGANCHMGNYSIKDLEKLSRVKAHTIRIWEKRYALLSPARSDTNIRSYSDEDLRRLLNVSLLNNHGVKISKIAKLTQTQIHEQVQAFEQSQNGPIDQVENLILAMTALDENRFERIMGNCILRLGFGETMLQVIQPFMQRVGVLWQIDAIKPGQEHFISNLVRQKVISAIDSLTAPPRADASTYLFFMPESEYHELGLLFGHYLVRKAGHRSIYLGQSVPFADLEAIVDHSAPDRLVVGFVNGHSVQEAPDYLRKLHSRFPKTLIHYFGNADVQGIPLATRLVDLRSFNSMLD